MKFLALYLASPAAIDQMMANATPEQMKAGMAAWMTWMKTNEKSMVDMGAPLGRTIRVSQSSSASVRNEVTGYTVVWADSHEAAARLFEGHPHLQVPGATIDIMPVMPIPVM
jgi:hypothetical protein